MGKLSTTSTKLDGEPNERDLTLSSSRILLLHEVLRVEVITLVENHLGELLQLLTCLHVVGQVHQQLNSVFFFDYLAVLFRVDLKEAAVSVVSLVALTKDSPL